MSIERMRRYSIGARIGVLMFLLRAMGTHTRAASVPAARARHPNRVSEDSDAQRRSDGDGLTHRCAAVAVAERALHQHGVDPAAELEAHRVQRADRLKAVAPVQR